MTEVTGLLAYFELLFIAFVLVTGGAVKLLAFDLFLFVQMRFMNVKYLFGEFDFFGLEHVIRFAVAGSRHAAGVDDSRSGFYGLTAELKVGEPFRWFLGDVTGFYLSGRRSRTFLLNFPGGIVTLDTAEFVVFGFFPEIVAFLDDTRVGQNMAIAAEKLGLGDVGRGELHFERDLLLLPHDRAKGQQ
jgi:hypothetical protein